MPEPGGLSALLDALASGGAATLGAPLLRALVAAAVLGILAAALVGAAAAIRAFRSARRRRGGETGRRPAAKAVEDREELREQVAEMVRRTNERNNYINSIFSSIEDGFLVADPANRVVLYNPRAQDLLGIGPSVFFDEARGRAESSPELSALLAACARVTSSKKPERLRLETGAGRTLDASVVPIQNKYRGAADFGSLAVARDVTEMRRMEAMKKDFVANVSHEFRTPLTLISGFMEMLKTRADIEPADRERAIEIVEIETERLRRLVSELLTLSEMESALPRSMGGRFEVAAVLGRLSMTLGELAGRKGLSFALEADVGDAVLAGNEDWFYQAVKNLGENAVKYTGAGGSVRVQASREAGALVVRVSDDGIGIAASEHERIFERFYRVEKSRGSGSGGSGLGLALVKDIASIFGGSVGVESAPGEGSVFELRIPLAAG